MPTPVEAIKDRLGIEELVRSYIKLEKAGTYLKARCPFHNEKTPSFFVSPSRETYYCFGCGAKGDIFTFVEQFEGVDFTGALRLLAMRAGVELKKERPEEREARARQYKLLEEATFFFESQLEKHKKVQQYLKERGLLEQSIDRWKIGYAPAGWELLSTALKEKGYSHEAMEKVGLIKKSEKKKGYYDRFRARVIFPITDVSGRIIGFSGRLYEPSDMEDTEAPKYLNSPETELFHKSRVLYGLDKAKLSIRKANFSIVVEGQIDVIASHQAGFRNTVAVSGTSLTQGHLEILSRHSQNVVFAFDADAAGLASAQKSASLALSLGMNVKMAALPSGVDPADMVKKSAEKWKSVIRKSEHAVEFFLGQLAKKHKDARMYKLEVHKNVLPLVQLITNKIDQAHFVAKVAEQLKVPERAIFEELYKLPASYGTTTSSTTREKREIETSPGSRKDALLQSLLGIIAWQKSIKNSKIDIKELQKKLDKITKNDQERKVTEAATFWAETTLADTESLEEIIEELLTGLEEEYVREKLHVTLSKLRDAETAGDAEKAKKLLVTCKKLSDSIALLKEKQRE